MRAVLYVFNSIEILLTLLCLGFHIVAFLGGSLAIKAFDSVLYPHYINMGIFYVFGLWAIYASTGLCGGERLYLLVESIRTGAAALLFMCSSLLVMFSAEKDVLAVYFSDLDTPVHPFVTYMRGQAITSLCCGVFYLLHFLFIFDVILSHLQIDSSTSSSSGSKSSEHEEFFTDYVPIRMYTFGAYIEGRLDRYQWFRDFR